MPNMSSKKEKSIKLHWYKGKSFAWNLVQFLINFNLFQHRNKFKEGDIVRYNWKAKVHLSSLFKNGWISSGNLLVTDIKYKDRSGVEYKAYGDDDGSCDPFWLRKAYWWEL